MVAGAPVTNIILNVWINSAPHFQCLSSDNSLKENSPLSKSSILVKTVTLHKDGTGLGFTLARGRNLEGKPAAVVANIRPGGPAEELQVQDQVLMVDGQGVQHCTDPCERVSVV